MKGSVIPYLEVTDPRLPTSEEFERIKEEFGIFTEVPKKKEKEKKPVKKKDKYYKIIISKHIVEIYHMDHEPFNKVDKDKFDEFSEHIQDTRLLSNNLVLVDEAQKEMRDRHLDKQIEKVDRKAERRSQTLRDARNTCRRLALANFNENDLFITLTYHANVSDINKTDEDFKQFIQRFKYKYGNFDYIAVREWQKRGAIHYHMICNAKLSWGSEEDRRHLERSFGLDHQDYQTALGLRNKKHLWGFGWVDIQRLSKTKEGKNVDNVGAYITKYMTKEISSTRLQGKKIYLPSKGLNRPIEYKGKITDPSIKQLIRQFAQKKEVFKNAYINEHLGQIQYKEYNLKRI